MVLLVFLENDCDGKPKRILQWPQWTSNVCEFLVVYVSFGSHERWNSLQDTKDIRRSRGLRHISKPGFSDFVKTLRGCECAKMVNPNMWGLVREMNPDFSKSKRESVCEDVNS